MHRSATLYLSIVGFAALGILFILHAGDRLSRPAVPPGNNSQTEIGSPDIPPAGVSLSDSIEKRLELNAENPLSRFFLQLFVVITISYSVGWIFTRCGQPAVVGEMMAGVLLGPRYLVWSRHTPSSSFSPPHRSTPSTFLVRSECVSLCLP